MVKRNVYHILTYIGLILIGIIFIFPFLSMISTSTKTSLEAVSFPPTLMGAKIRFSNYVEAFRAVHFSHSLKNSVIITVSVVLGQIIICVPAAYAFAKKKFKLRNLFFAMSFSNMMIPGQITFIPLYLLISKLGWIDTYWALIIPFMYSGFSVFFMTNSFKQIPDELIDAARLDKASELQIIYRIMFPIIKSVVITLCLITAIQKWNDYFWCLVFTNTEKVRTLPFMIKSLTLVDKTGIPSWNIMMAGDLMLVAPLLILYILANNKIKNAFVYGGIK